MDSWSAKRVVCRCVFQARRADRPLSTQLWMIDPHMKYTQSHSVFHFFFVLVLFYTSDRFFHNNKTNALELSLAKRYASLLSYRFLFILFFSSVCVCRVKAAIFLLGEKKIVFFLFNTMPLLFKIFIIIYKGCAFNLRCHLLRH